LEGEGGGGVGLQALKKFTDPVQFLEFLDPLANKSKRKKKKEYSHEIKINQYLAQFLFYRPGTFKNRFPSLIYI
jgi:hypothetical protein